MTNPVFHLPSKVVSGFAAINLAALSLAGIADAGNNNPYENHPVVTWKNGALNTFQSNGVSESYTPPALAAGGERSADYICPLPNSNVLEASIVTRQNDIFAAQITPATPQTPETIQVDVERHHVLNDLYNTNLHYSFSAHVFENRQGEHIVLDSASDFLPPQADQALASYIHRFYELAKTQTCGVPQKEMHTIFLPYGTSITSFKTSPIIPYPGAAPDSDYFTATVRPNTERATVDVYLDGRDANNGNHVTGHVEMIGVSNHINQITVNSRPVADSELRNYGFMVVLAQRAVQACYSKSAPSGIFGVHRCNLAP